MSMFGYSDPPTRAARSLRRLNHSAVVKTSYLTKVAEIEIADNDSSEAAGQGYEDGYSAGLARAKAEAAEAKSAEERRIECALAALSSAIRAVEQTRAVLDSEMRTTIPRVAFNLLERLLGRELELAANPGRDAVARAMSLDDSDLTAVIRLNPRDLEKLGEISDLTSGREVSLIPDSGVEPGGALVDLGGATVDAQIGAALERVRSVLVSSSGLGK